MAGPYSERQELEDLRKLKRLEELEAKAAGRSVSAPPQAAPTAPASPFLQRGMKMVAGAQAPAPNQNILPGMGRGNMGTPTARPAYMGNPVIIDQVAQAAAAQQEEERKSRVAPVAKAADIAAAQAKEKARAESPFYDRTDLMAFKDAARQQVYNQAGVVSPSDAFTGRSANALALGIPGIVNEDFRGQLAQAGEDQPGAALAGDAAFLIPSIGAWNTVRTGVNALVRPFIPRGADAASRTVRYGAPRAGEVAGTAGLNATFQAGVQEPIRAETAGEDLTLGGMAEAGKRGFTDPLNLIPLGLSGTNRIWNQLTSGIATPSARAAEMANLYGVGPRQTAASQGIAQTTQALGGQLQGADIRGLTNIENALRFALRDNRNIPDVNARIATGFQRIRESLPLEDDPTLNLARLIEREFAPDAPQTRDILRNFLRGVGLNSPGGGQIVGDAANQMRGQQADVLRTELESSFGAQPKTEAQAALQESLDQFSAAYNNVMPQAPRTGPQAEEALDLLIGSRTNQLPPETNLQAILYRRAQERNMTVDNFILQNPLEALHWVQSDLADQARSLRAAKTPDANLERVVQNMQRPLRDALPEYGELQSLWRQYSQALGRLGYTRGAEAGVKAELTPVPGFGDKIFGPGGISKSEEGTQTAADLYLQMDDLSQRAAGLSVRDVINDELRKGKAAGLEERYQTAANMRRVATEGGLDALRRVFGEAGDRVARRIEQFMGANEFARNIDPEFNSATINKGQAMATGAQPFAGPMGQATQGAAGSLGQNAVGDAFMMASGITSAPVLSAIKFVPWLANRLQPGARTQRNIAETLLRRGEIGSQVPPRPGGPAPIAPIDPAMVPGARPPPGGAPPQGAPPPQAPPQAPRTVGVAPAAAGAPAGAPVPTPPPTPVRGAGFALGPGTQATLQQSAMGSLGGSAYGNFNDVNQDGVIDEQDVIAGGVAGGVGLPLAARGVSTVGRPRAPGVPPPMPDAMPAGGYFGRQSLRPPGSGPSPREIEIRQQWSTATPIVTQARTTAQSAQQAADAALQSKALADIARAKDAKKTLVGQLQKAQASRAGMDTPEDARLAETLASLAENTSDPVLLSTQISAAKTSLDRLLTDIGSPVEGNLIPVRTQILTRTQAPRSAAEPAPERPSVTRYAEGGDEIKPQGFGASTPNTPQQAARFETPGSPEYEAAVAKGLDMSQAGRMGRAKKMGYDVDNPLYHGTDADITAFRTSRGGTFGEGVYLSDAEHASMYADMETGANVIPVYVRGKIATEADVPIELTRGNEIADWAYDNGYAGYKHTYTGGGTETVIFDPKNIRSVNAAFDPDKSTSSTLLAAAPFAAVGGAGLTIGQDRNAVPPPPPIKPQRGSVRPPPPLR